MLLESEVDFALDWQLHGDCMILQESSINLNHTTDNTTSILCSYLCIYIITQLGFRTDPEWSSSDIWTRVLVADLQSAEKTVINTLWVRLVSQSIDSYCH